MWANALTPGSTVLGPLWPSIVSIIAPFRGIELRKSGFQVLIPIYFLMFLIFPPSPLVSDPEKRL